jgi:hypothetical protein
MVRFCAGPTGIAEREEKLINFSRHFAFMRLAPKIDAFMVAVLACLSMFSLPGSSAGSISPQASKPNLSGTWTLDRKASTPLEPLMLRVGASYLERRYAGSAPLKATFHQTDQVLTVATRGPGYALDETLQLNGQTVPSNMEIVGGTSVNVRAAWSKDSQQLVETRQIKTKSGKQGELVIKRQLTDQGKSMLLIYTLKLSGEPDTTFVRQIWRKQP